MLKRLPVIALIALLIHQVKKCWQAHFPGEFYS